MREIHKHRCLWFYQTAREAEKATYYSKAKKARPRAVLFCWQTGKNIRTRECSNCIKGRLVTCVSSVFCALDHKQPMTSAEWDKRHKKK